MANIKLGLKLRKQLRPLFLLFLAIIFLLPTFFILYWLVTKAVETTAEINTYPPTLIPQTFTLEHIELVIKKQNIFRYAMNSIIISGSTTLIGIIAGMPAAYGLVHLGKQSSWGLWILITRMLPGLLALIGWYNLFSKLHLLNTYASIVLTHLIYAIPLIIWIMIGYFEEQDPDLEAAALVDGCTKFRAFILVGVPLAGPGMTVSAILVFVYSWNDFIRGLIFAGPDKRPLTMAVYRAMSLESLHWGEMMAAALFVIFPIAIITIFLQKYIIAGLTQGGIKG